jgi:hypothetical protein
MSKKLARRSSNDQDTTFSNVAMAVKVRPRRSTVRCLIVRDVPAKDLASMMTTRHYLHTMPNGAVACFGVFLDSELVGGVVFTMGARHGHYLLAGSNSSDVVTLARLYLDDEIPKNAESRVLGIVTREMRRRHGARALLSYADPTVGHTGTIYKAAGSTYMGRGEPARYLDFGDGQLRHPRSISSVYGTCSPRRLARMGVHVTAVRTEGKHRFYYLLDSSWAWRLKDSIGGAA